MTKLVTTVLAVLLGAALLSAADAPKAFNPGPGWTVAYQSDFSKGKTDDWDATGGKVSIKDGVMVFEGDADDTNQLMLKGVKCPGGVQVEFVVSGAAEKLSDLSPILNAGDSGYDTGYMLQFGGKANTVNELLKEGEVVEGTSKNAPLLKADKVYHVVAANDGGKISLTVDGTEIFSYTDKTPLKGAGHDRIGLYTYGMKLKIEKVTVYTKDQEPKK